MLSIGEKGFTEPCVSSLPFSGVQSFELQANGQMFSLHDCNRDGVADFQTSWTVVEFRAAPLACADPYDPRHLIVPLSGFYRIVAEPVRVVILPEQDNATTQDFRSLQPGGRP